MRLPTDKPNFDAPLQSWKPMLIQKGIDDHHYNLVKYGDIHWAVSWEETDFDADRFFAGEAQAAILIGETREEIELGLPLLLARMRLDTASGTEAARGGQATAAVLGKAKSSLFSEEATNLYRFHDQARPLLEEKLPHSPGIANSRLLTANLFEVGDGQPVVIVSPAPSRACNYRCEYCFHHEHGFTQNTSAMDGWSKAILTAVKRIPRPLILSLGAMGEPLLMPKWRETALTVLGYSKVQQLAFVTNLFTDPREFMANVDDPTRIGVLATLHPSEFKDHDHDLYNFIDRITWLRDQGASVAVNYVLTPEQIQAHEVYRKIMSDHGITLIRNILRGPYRGKMYPEAYSPEEYAMTRECHADLPFVYDYQSHEMSPYGVKCVSGRWAFHLEFDGTVYNCDFARERLGSIYDDKVKMRTENCQCTASICESQVMISFMEDVIRDYRVQGNMHAFDRRPAGELGVHPAL